MNAKEQQFTNIIKEHERTIYTVCYMFSSDSDEVNDLYQDILVRLWQGFDAFEGKKRYQNVDLSRQFELLYQLQQPAEKAARTAEP